VLLAAVVLGVLVTLPGRLRDQADDDRDATPATTLPRTLAGDLTLTAAGECFRDARSPDPRVVNVVACGESHVGEHLVDVDLPDEARTWTEGQRQDAAAARCADEVDDLGLGLVLHAEVAGARTFVAQCYAFVPGAAPPVEPASRLTVGELDVGACFDGTGGEEVVLRPCVEDHDAELVAVVDLTGIEPDCEAAASGRDRLHAVVENETLHCLAIADDALDRFSVVLGTS
jgi:hypothetical protein